MPQIVFLLAIFGYMDVMIVCKWFTNYKGYEGEAPSIIVTVVNFFLAGGEVKGRPFFAGNQTVSQILLLVAVLCVPWMLLVKAYLEWQDEVKKNKARQHRGDYELEQIPHQYQNF